MTKDKGAGDMSSDLNGKTGTRWITLVPFAVLLIGGGITWGETRTDVSSNAAKLVRVAENHSRRFISVEADAEKTKAKVNALERQQGRIDERLKNIKDGQDKQERLLLDVLREIKRETR